MTVIENLTLLTQDTNDPITQVATSQDTICTLSVFSQLIVKAIKIIHLIHKTVVGIPVEFVVEKHTHEYRFTKVILLG